MTLKIAHTADIHIRPHAYLDEMEYTFDRFFESLAEQEPDLVVVAGDVFHSKLTVSSEYFDIAFRFFKRLSDYNVIVVPGNHDTALTNQGRMDALTPVINAVISTGTKKNFKYSKFSESFELPSFPNAKFHHLSIFGKKEQWPNKDNADPEKINIAIYHGAINQCIVDNGWVSRGNKDELTIFNGFDFGLLGDIHKFQYLDDAQRIAYPGSLRQNNFGEDIEKGYLLWTIDNKDVFKSERVILDQKRYFFTLHLASSKDLLDLGELPPDCRIRVKLTKEITAEEELRIKEEIVSSYKPHGEVLVIPPDEDISANLNVKVGNLDIIHENIRDAEVQKDLIQAYLERKEVAQDKIDKVIALDKQYHSFIDSDVLRNITYKIKELKWSNFLSYGKSNIIDFEKINGLIGVFGPNGSGKSTIFDTLCFAIENSIYREGANKNGDYINRKCKRSDIGFVAELDNKKYGIERTIKKIYYKDQPDRDPKVENEVDFFVYPKNDKNKLNGETTPDTNKKIRDIFGTKEDLEITSYCSQFGLTAFIDARGTKRKESLAKFFDLGIFETKYSHADEEYKEIRKKLKELGKAEYIKDGEKLRTAIAKEEWKQKEFDQIIQELNLGIETLENQRSGFQLQLLKEDVVYDEHIDNKIEQVSNNIVSLLAEQRRVKTKISSYADSLNIDPFNQDELNEKFSNLKQSVEKLNQKKTRLVVLEKQAALIESIPGHDVCRGCHLAKHAYEAKIEIDASQPEIEVLSSDLEAIKQIRELIALLTQMVTINERITSLQFQQENLKTQKEKMLQSAEIYEINLQIKHQMEECKNKIRELRREVETLNDDKLDSAIRLGAARKMLELHEKTTAQQAEFSEKEEIYSLYLDAMGKNGISYWIISKKLLLINKLTNQILAHAVPFKFSVEDNEEEKSIKLYIIDEKGKRPAELASGGEKTVIALALRAALWKICLLPKTPILILDESLAFLDGERLDSVIKLLKYLSKEYFDKIFIITHNDELKRVMDTSITIEKRKEFSFIEVK